MNSSSGSSDAPLQEVGGGEEAAHNKYSLRMILNEAKHDTISLRDFLTSYYNSINSWIHRTHKTQRQAI
ncbi:hypothetical protein E2C01_066645 [Portunus trituberculatus]|uniref:Uncharacterized protein n=1 Tax=Portunus trituberculatus TaxID=210409 RepID=A0A5B7HM29_PORTR|nr:hypothetical protein [Portunus trituberculatus]